MGVTLSSASKEISIWPNCCAIHPPYLAPVLPQKFSSSQASLELWMFMHLCLASVCRRSMVKHTQTKGSQKTAAHLIGRAWVGRFDFPKFSPGVSIILFCI